MTLFGGVLLVAALAAAVLAVVQLARQSARLRDELDELRSASVPGAAGPGKSRGDAPRLFGELYEARPSPFEALGEWPGVPLAVAAAGLFAIGLFTNRPSRAPGNPADSTIAKDIAAARMQYDSLAKEVDALQDSVALLRKPVAAASRVTERKVASRSVAQKTEAAPLPSLPKVEP